MRRRQGRYGPKSPGGGANVLRCVRREMGCEENQGPFEQNFGIALEKFRVFSLLFRIGLGAKVLPNTLSQTPSKTVTKTF